MTPPLHSDSGLCLCPTCDVELSADTLACPRCGTATLAVRAGVADANLGRVLAGRYEIRALLGRGGMGSVYRAWQREGEREVAVKLIHEQCRRDRMWLRRFLREAHLASQLQHPHTVAILDFGQTDDGDLFLAMELMKGRTLADVVAAEGAFDRVRTARLGAQLCDGLAAAHAQRIVHRDLKPANVMILDEPAGRDFVKILDFGLAKALGVDETEVTQTGHLLGTPRYLAPELFFGHAPGPETDLYAIGVLLCETHLGRRLFTSDALGGLQLEKGAPVLPESIDAGLRELLERLLEPNPTRRLADAALVRSWLEHCSDGRPRPTEIPRVAAPPTVSLSVPAPAPGRWSRRTAALAAVVAAVAVAASLALFAATRSGSPRAAGVAAAAVPALDAAPSAPEPVPAVPATLPDPVLRDRELPAADDLAAVELRLHVIVVGAADDRATPARFAALVPELDALVARAGVHLDFDPDTDYELVADAALLADEGARAARAARHAGQLVVFVSDAFARAGAVAPAASYLAVDPDVSAPALALALGRWLGLPPAPDAATMWSAGTAAPGADALRRALPAGDPVAARRYDAVFYKPAVPTAQVRQLGQPLAELDARDAALGALGFHLVVLQSYDAGAGQRRYDAVWQLGASATVRRFDLAQADFRKQHDELAEQGYKLIGFQGHDTPRGRRYEGLWNRGSEGKGQNLRFAWARNDLRGLIHELRPPGYVLVALQSYEMGTDVWRYDALFTRVWRDSIAQLGWRHDRFAGRSDELAGSGWGLVALQSYELAPHRRHYDGVWEPIAKSTPHLPLYARGGDELATKWALLASQGYVLKTLRVRESTFAAGDR